MSIRSLAVAMLLALATLPAFAEDAPVPKPTETKFDKYITDALPVCADMKLSRTEMQHKLPANLTGSVIRVESARNACDGQFVHVVSREGDFFLGIPWFLDDVEGTTLEEKLSSFGWKALGEHLIPVVDRTKTRSGLYKVILNETTERGKMPIEGEIDPAGKIFFLGHFHPIDQDVRTWRLKAFEPFLANAPAEGAAKPEVTVVEFSDFECPSCQHASKYMNPIIASHGDRVRYIRYDLPLISSHPWAFAAAVAGRAVYRQKADLFWEYKKQVYENQEKLSAFTFDDFARGFAQDHELNLAKYDADIASADVRNEILKGVGTAFSNDIRATPTYMVNGRLVDAGVDGKALTEYVEKLLAK
ncbi:MAG: thioredoxin domain-containing protein [Acidobacteriota bacterium]